MESGINAIFINTEKFSVETNLTDVLVEGRKIKAECGDDGIKYGCISTSSFVPSAGVTKVTLSSECDDLTSNLTHIWYEAHPHMDDGRPIIRSDTRPLNSQTVFTMAGDSADDLGDGKEFKWDFSNDDDSYTGSEVPSGYKAKEMLVSFKCPVHIKDGTIYFFNAPWGSYVQMDIVIPDGAYYPNPQGPIPASALGLSGKKMYAQASGNTLYQRYVNKHFMFGDCPMGDELNAEGSSVSPIPVGWYIRGLIVTPNSDNVSKGFASIEMHRCHTVLLPGQTIANLHG